MKGCYLHKLPEKDWHLLWSMAKIFDILTFPFLQQNSLDSVDLGLSSFYLQSFSFYNTHTMNTYTVAHLGTHTHTHTFTSTSSHASTLTHTYTLSVLFVSFADSHSVSLFLFIPFLPFFLSFSFSISSSLSHLSFPFLLHSHSSGQPRSRTLYFNLGPRPILEIEQKKCSGKVKLSLETSRKKLKTTISTMSWKFKNNQELFSN